MPSASKAQELQPTDLFFNEIQTIYLVNLERRKAGLPPLRWNEELTQSARKFAADVIAHQPVGYCGHTDSEGRTPSERMRLAGFTKLEASAENSACGYTTPEASVRIWMNSDAHRKNLLDSRLREIGIGAALSATYRGYIVADLALDTNYAPVIIDNEAPSTTSLTVQLYIYNQATRSGFMGQGQSVEMMISNDPNFGDAVWKPYAAETTWTLTGGAGWKTVYVKTRDALGRTVVAQDSIYFGEVLPLDQLSFNGASRFGTGLRLERIDAPGWPQVQFSLDWVGDNSDPNFTASAFTELADAAAVGGAAVRLARGGTATVWTGGYLASLPATAYFRVKVSDNSTSQEVLRLRVQGVAGDAGQRVLRGVDFSATDSYQEFAVPYNLGGAASLVTFRFDRLGDADVTVDAVTLFSAPMPVAAPLQWQTPDNYLRNCGVQARFVKEDGSFSSVFEVHSVSGQLIADETIALSPQLSVTPPSVWFEAMPGDAAPPSAQLSVKCIRCDEGPWQATTQIQWLQLAPSSDALEVVLTPAGLAPGIYREEITISAPAEARLAPVVVPVTVVVGDATALLPERLYLPAVVR
jgi:hypothetical protein